MRYNSFMAIRWSTRRQILYYIVAMVVAVITLTLGYKLFFAHAATCSDGIKNGTEIGVDCGGSCSLICESDAKAPRVLWARSFKTDTSLYTSAAYIQNPNYGAAARAVQYSFQLFDKDNVLVVECDGVTDIP